MMSLLYHWYYERIKACACPRCRDCAMWAIGRANNVCKTAITCWSGPMDRSLAEGLAMNKSWLGALVVAFTRHAWP